MFVPLRKFGQFGVISDSMGESLPIGTWSDALNIRFTGIELQKMLEPVLEAELVALGYDCDAFKDGLISAGFDYIWLLNDKESSYLGVMTEEVSGSTILSASGSAAHAGEIPAILDSCSGITGWQIRPVGYVANEAQLEIVHPAAHDIITSGFSYAAAMRKPAAARDSVTLLSVTYQYYTNTNHTVAIAIAFLDADTINVNVTSSGTVSPYNISATLPSSIQDDTTMLVYAEYDEVGVTVYVDNIVIIDHTFRASLGGADQPLPLPGAQYTSAKIRMFYNSSWYIQDIGLGNALSSDDLAALWVQFQRNFTGYSGGGITEALWFQPWSNGLSSSFAVATASKLYMWQASSETNGLFLDATRSSGDYDPSGQWQSFEWGDTVIFNNGKDIPQIYDPGLGKFKDLPSWGIISSAEDLTFNTDPTRDTGARCKVLLPYKNFLVALGTSEGHFSPNTVWWSDATSLSTYREGLGDLKGPPSWDYESPSTLSGKQEIGVGEGELTWGAVLNENLIIYSLASATAMQAVGGNQVMSFRRLFSKGCAGLHLAAEFNNRHFVVSRDQLYVHDGSSVKLIAKDRIEDEFFKRAGKGGRHS